MGCPGYTYAMSRPAKGDGPETIRIPTTGKLRAYLKDLRDEQGFGEDATNVAKRLIWDGIEHLIKEGVLVRKKGAFPGDETDSA